MTQLKPIIEQSMTQYAGAVLQSRALVDVRDFMKPSARQIFYCLYTDKFLPSKPYKGTLKAIGSMARLYIHGDSSGEGIIMRAGQPFAYRYPLVDVEGNGGDLLKSGDWAAPRYTGVRLSQFSSRMFGDIDKDTIDEWRDNYDDTEQYPMVLPSKGFYNLVNGTCGIGVGMASSVPQYNLKELNNALIHLIDNPDCDFEDIYCAPDFATGAILFNEKEVKESMKNGTGFACKLRSVVEFDAKDRCFVVTEIPYGVYTETICGQLEEICNGENNPGIERFNDLTGKGDRTKTLIKIYLSKKANPDRVLKFLFKNTSLQDYYGINFTLLDMGRFPKVFTWKEMLQAHINHEKVVYRRGFEFDLRKIENRIHILDGLLVCLARIDEVVAVIKGSASTAAASLELRKQFLLDEAQAKAVLDMKLSRLAHLEVKKLEDERTELQKDAARINEILNNEGLFNEQLKNGWRETSRLYGDDRRTKIIHLAEGSDNEPIEKKQLSLSFTNTGAVYVSETSTLYAQRRNGTGTKFKLEKEEYVIDNIIGENTSEVLFFTNKGNFYHKSMGEFTIDDKQYLSSFVNFGADENLVAAALCAGKEKHIIFITKNGILKKSKLSEYNMKRNIGAAALKLDPNDQIVSILFTDEDRIGIASTQGQFIMIETKDISAIGRVARGVQGMKLNEGDCVVSARVIKSNDKELISVSEDGYIKRTDLSEFRVTGRATKGVKIQNTSKLCDFLPSSTSNDILVVSTTSQIRLKLQDIPSLSRGTQGVKSLKLPDSARVMKLGSF